MPKPQRSKPRGPDPRPTLCRPFLWGFAARWPRATLRSMSIPQRALHLALIASFAAVALLLGGCSRGPDAMMADYGARVARITGQPVDLPRATGAPYPRPRDLAVPVPEVRIRLLDLTDFARCNLTRLIAERNGTLGRSWPASQRLDYEFRFGHRLDRCAAWLDGQDALDDDSAALRAEVQALRPVKAATRPVVWWQASWASDEFSRHFSAAAPLPERDTRAPLAAFTPLVTLARQLDAPPDGVPLGELEAALQQLRSQRYGGGWVRATLLMVATLNQSAAALDATDTARLCPQGKSTPKARVFETVFYRVYADRLQPYLSTLHREGADYLDALAPLLAHAPNDAPPAFKRYAPRYLQRGPDSLWVDLATARDRHTEAWQRVLGDCGLMPDGSRPQASSGSRSASAATVAWPASGRGGRLRSG